MSPRDAASSTLQVLDRLGRGLRVTWLRDGDRYGHEIAVVVGSTATVCLRAELGRDRDPWPASPPLQQSSRETAAGGRMKALFLGMAGKSHWSQSIETEDAGPPALTFDVACRVQRPPQWLGSTYRATGALSAISASCVRLAIAQGLDVTLTALTGSLPEHAAPCSWVVDGSQLALVAERAPPQLPATVRWGYRIALGAAPVASRNMT